MTKSSAKDVPVFWGHGTADPVVQYECMTFPGPPAFMAPFADCADGQRSIELLKTLNFPILSEGTTFQRPGVRFENYPGMAHSSSDREIRDLKAWLQECLKD